MRHRFIVDDCRVRNEQMQETSLPRSAARLFSHVTAEKTAVYRVIMEVFATASSGCICDPMRCF
jgi:hypothetical protein